MSAVDRDTGEIVEPLTDDEAARLAHKERVIERSADQVAQELTDIRDERLYRRDYSTFEAYCRERWGMSRQHANRQIVAAEVAAALEPMGSKLPERQTRELADLRDDPDALRDTYQRAHDATDGNVTAAALREARTRRDGNPETGPNVGIYERSPLTPDVADERSAAVERGIAHIQDERQQERQERPKARRRPLPDAFFEAAHDLGKKVEALHRLTEDDRWSQNANEVNARYGADLIRYNDLLQQVINSLTKESSNVR